MRFIVIFSDRTSRRVSEDEAVMFRKAMVTGGVVGHRGSAFSGHSIVAIKPMHVHEQEKREEAESSGIFRCRYGRVHANKSECSCRDAGYTKILEEQEEILLLEGSNGDFGETEKLLKDDKWERDCRTLGFPDDETAVPMESVGSIASRRPQPETYLPLPSQTQNALSKN